MISGYKAPDAEPDVSDLDGAWRLTAYKPHRSTSPLVICKPLIPEEYFPLFLKLAPVGIHLSPGRSEGSDSFYLAR